LEALLERTDVDVVVITTPNDSHFEYAKKAVEAGKHVVLEKPFTITSADAAELVQLSKTTGRIISPFHNRRYVADFRTMQPIVHQKLLGEFMNSKAGSTGTVPIRNPTPGAKNRPPVPAFCTTWVRT
jgi:scyllo-inositol 2-dehydrogenase (NADP+)